MKTMPGFNRTKNISHLVARTLCLTLSVAAASHAFAADGKLSYFTWSGYELEDFHKPYPKMHQEGVDISVFGDDNEALTKVKSGFSPDLAHPCVDALPKWREAGLIQPLDTKRIKNWDKIYPAFKNMGGVSQDGKVWMVPWDWGNVSVLYRTDKISNPEQSWNLLWDKKYTGKLATIDSVHDTVIVGAMMAGVNPYNMSASDLAKVKAKLQQQRPLIRTYTNDMSSIEQALASGELNAAMTWNSSAVALKKQGVPVKFMNPKEGMLTWVCGMVLLKNAKNVDKAYDFINARLDPTSGKALITNYGYGATNKDAIAMVDKKQLEDLSIPADPQIELKKTKLISPMKNADAAAAMFESVKAGM